MNRDTGYSLPDDVERIDGQRQRVWRVMSDGHWRSLANIGRMVNASTPSVSARLRDFRKPQFGAHTIERYNAGEGVWWYRLVANECGLLDGKTRAVPKPPPNLHYAAWFANHT